MTAKPQVPDAYRNTTVSVFKSQAAVDALLQKYKAANVLWQQGRIGDKTGVAIRFERGGRAYRIATELGETAQQQRQRMRALYWGLKALLEQAHFGILKLEDTLLAYTEVALPDGRTTTVGRMIQPQIERAELPDLTREIRALTE